MKRIVTYLFLVFLSSLVFYGGAGVNLVSYCCSHCEKFGIEALTSSQCCKLHHDHADQASCHVSTTHGDMNKHQCGFERINFKWISDDDQQVDIQPVELDLIFASVLERLEVVLFNHPFFEDLRITGPPVFTYPRIYLSLLTTLLI